MDALTTVELLWQAQEQRGQPFMEGLDLVLRQAAARFRDERPGVTGHLSGWDLHLEHLRRVAPEAYELVIQLPEQYQRGLRLFFPIWEDEPFVGVEINGKGMMPADPGAYAVCKRLTDMLWEENPYYMRSGMEAAHRQRHLYPRDMPDDNPEILIDA